MKIISLWFFRVFVNEEIKLMSHLPYSTANVRFVHIISTLKVLEHLPIYYSVEYVENNAWLICSSAFPTNHENITTILHRDCNHYTNCRTMSSLPGMTFAEAMIPKPSATVRKGCEFAFVHRGKRDCAIESLQKMAFELPSVYSRYCCDRRLNVFIGRGISAIAHKELYLFPLVFQGVFPSSSSLSWTTLIDCFCVLTLPNILIPRRR